MKKVYYKGQPYDYETIDMMGERLFVLYQNKELMHYVKEDELDIRSRVSFILDAYYSAPKPSQKTEVLS
jgi:hypothetical protein